MAEAADTFTTANSSRAPVLDCPLCSEVLKKPKILPCGHLMCRTCVLTTLEAETGKPSECPLCNYQILSSHETDIDLNSFVDDLPTDHGTWLKIECNNIVNAEAVCKMCDNESEAVSYCFQCDIKLCTTCCTKWHSRLPATSEHTVEELSTLTAENLAVKRCVPCKFHNGRTIEKYCSTHRELVCLLCAWSFHKSCDGVEDITVSAERKRKDLEQQNEKLKQIETSLSEKQNEEQQNDKLKQIETTLSDEIDKLNKQMTNAVVKFNEMRERVITTYMDIIKRYEGQKHTLLDDIDKEEQAYLDEEVANRDKLQELRAAIVTHTISVGEFVSSTPDLSLLDTLGKLQSQLNDLEERNAALIGNDKAKVGDVYIDDKMLSCVMKMADFIGQVADEPPLPQKSVTESVQSLCDVLSVTEGTFQYVIENYNSTEHVSRPCFIGNIPWRIALKPGCISLLCDVPEHFTLWHCTVKGEVRILKAVPQEKPWQKGFEHTFNSKSSRMGIDYFIFGDLACSGYVKNGRVTLEVHIVVKDQGGHGQQ